MLSPVLVSLICSGMAGPTSSRVGSGGYPRGVELRGPQKHILFCLNGDKTMTVVRQNGSSPLSDSWVQQGTVLRDDRAGVDLSNCELVQLANGTVLASYRHHTGCSKSELLLPLPHARSCETYTLQVSSSHDDGRSWEQVSTIISGTIGMWEPFFFVKSNGDLWVSYSQEITNGGMQSIVWQQSADMGISWEAPQTISDGHEHHSRDGMPGIATLVDGSLLVVYEQGVAGHFSVHTRRSFDQGKSWSSQETVYAGQGHNAGAPQLAVEPKSKNVIVSFMTDEDTPSKWPSDASVKYLVSNNTGASEAPLVFDPSSRKVACSGPNCMWSGLLNAADATWVSYGRGGSSFIFGPIGGGSP
jgi:hypothetical protein